MVTIENKYVVYKITNIINNKIYIGMTGNLETRWSGNGTQYRPHNNDNHRPFWNAINKYGWDNFKKEIIEDKLTFEEAIEGEIFYIAFFDATNREIGYNLSPGGNGGRIYLEHPKGMLGKEQTTYQKENHKKWASNKDNNCMTNGKVVWGETHEHPKGMLGKNHSEEHKAFLRTKTGSKSYSAKKIRAVLPNKEVKTFGCLKDCANHFDLSPTSSVIRNLLKTNEPYVCSPKVRRNREKYESLEGLTLEYVS